MASIRPNEVPLAPPPCGEALSWAFGAERAGWQRHACERMPRRPAAPICLSESGGRVNMPTMLDNLLAWCRTERASLQQQLNMMERGIKTTGERLAGAPAHDTTADSIADARRKIAEIDDILARHPDA